MVLLTKHVPRHPTKPISPLGEAVDVGEYAAAHTAISVRETSDLHNAFLERWVKIKFTAVNLPLFYSPDPVWGEVGPRSLLSHLSGGIQSALGDGVFPFYFKIYARDNILPTEVWQTHFHTQPVTYAYIHSTQVTFPAQLRTLLASFVKNFREVVKAYLIGAHDLKHSGKHDRETVFIDAEFTAVLSQHLYPHAALPLEKKKKNDRSTQAGAAETGFFLPG